MATEQPKTKVRTGKVRFSYVHVFEPSSMSGNAEDAKYSTSILIDKDDKQTLDIINSGIEAAKEVSKSKLSKGGKFLPGLKMPLRDGDVDRPDDEAYAGKWFLNASSNRKPAVVDKGLNPLTSSDEFYSGCYGRVMLNFYAFDKNGSRGIAVGLGNIQLLEVGENLTGATSADQDFGDDLEG